MTGINKPREIKSGGDRFSFGLASPQDSSQILEILEEGHYGGNISLLYTRRNDAFASFMREGEEVNIITCRDSLNDRIASIGACAQRTLYVNGIPRKVGYLFNLKTRSEYRKMFRFLPKGYEYCYQVHREKKLPFFLMTILEGNRDAIKLFEKRRAFMPGHYPLGTYRVFAFKTGLKCKPMPGFHFRRCSEADMPAVLQFLNETGKNYQFFPWLQPEDFRDKSKKGISPGDFYSLHDDRGEITACGAIWDQKTYKQYIVKGYRGFFKRIAPFSAVLPVFGYPHILAKPGTILDFFTLSYWAVKDNHPGLFTHFLKNISQCPGAKDYRFFVLGIHDANTLKNSLERLPHFSYTSRIYLVDWDKSGNRLNQLDRDRVLYLECGTL